MYTQYLNSKLGKHKYKRHIPEEFKDDISTTLKYQFKVLSVELNEE